MSKKAKSKSIGKPRKTAMEQLRSSCERTSRLALTRAEKKPGSRSEIYDAIVGRTAPPKDALLASFIEPRIKAAVVVKQGVAKALQVPASSAYAMAVTPANMGTSLEDFELDPLSLRKLKTGLKKLSADVIGMTQFHTSSVDGRIEVHPVLRLIAYGQDLSDTKVADLQRWLRNRDVSAAATMEYYVIRPEPAAIATAAAQLFNMSDARCPADADPKEWKRQRSLRELRRLFALASVPFKQLCIAMGDGERLLDKAIVEGKHLLKPMWREKEQVIHRDEIATFIAAELVRLGLTHHRVPFVRVR